MLTLSMFLVGCAGKETSDSASLPSEPDPIVQDYDGDGFFNDVDCNDLEPSIHPDAVEICDGIDNDCDALIDDEDDNLIPDTTWYRDVDEDGYGDAYQSIQSCTTQIGYVGNDEDCDDSNAQINPLAEEICDGLDNNCNGRLDSDDESLIQSELVSLIPDEDGDGYP